MALVKNLGLCVIAMVLLLSGVATFAASSNSDLPSLYPDLDLNELDSEERQNLAEEILGLFGPMAEFHPTSSNPSSTWETVRVLETSRHETLLTFDQARISEWPILLPDPWPDFVSNADLENATLTLTETTYLNADMGPNYDSNLVVPGQFQIRQRFTDGLFPTPGHFHNHVERPVRVMAVMVHNRPALLSRIAGSTVELTWSTEAYTVSISALRNEISELDMLRFAHSLR